MIYAPPKRLSPAEKKIKGDDDRVERSRPLYPNRIGERVVVVRHSIHAPAPLIIRFPDGHLGIADRHDLKEA